MFAFASEDHDVFIFHDILHDKGQAVILFKPQFEVGPSFLNNKGVVKNKEIVSVKTAEAIPKDKIFACVEALKDLTISAPVSIGDIIVPDVAGTGVDLIATSASQKI